jgi:uncharacterized protein DUF2784
VLYRLAADAIVLLHLGFVLFVAAGGALALRKPGLAWLHLPAAAWGAGIELAGGVCPLTPLENRLRQLGGQAGYPGGFVDHYLLPALYPADLTRRVEIGLGIAILLGNAALYAVVIRRARLWRRRRA